MGAEGAFDITVGPLLKAWGFFKDAGRIPSESEQDVVRQVVGWRNLVLDSKEQTISFVRSGVEMDPGGIGKGYAVDRMSDILRSQGVASALISAAGSSLYAIGALTGKQGWKIELSHPSGFPTVSASALLCDGSVSTSGTEGRSVVDGGKLYGHIMDPRCAKPLTGAMSVSVITPKTIDSEAWGKPFLILGRLWTEHHKPSGSRVYFCDEKDGSQTCAWIS